MGHSVERHLAVGPAAYDDEIRRFVPGYDAMLDEAASAVAEHAPGAARVLDLGAGTGALSERVAARCPGARFVLLDADAAMLARAGARLEGLRGRLELRAGRFTDPLPAADAAVASLALHHVPDLDEKARVYRGVAASLAPGAPLVVADAFLPEAPALAAPVWRRWAAHLVAGGDTEAEAFARFGEWQKEDRYFSLAQELAALASAGFAADVRWRGGPVAVIVALRGAAPPGAP
ncbi:MAG TPA: class I SAM-dependent methyltransferase [Polyangiaceae bacterium]|nr:class I SAM-dependent methyltransferase [Polyangiaceae bacterium]